MIRRERVSRAWAREFFVKIITHKCWVKTRLDMLHLSSGARGGKEVEGQSGLVHGLGRNRMPGRQATMIKFSSRKRSRDYNFPLIAHFVVAINNEDGRHNDDQDGQLTVGQLTVD